MRAEILTFFKTLYKSEFVKLTVRSSNGQRGDGPFIRNEVNDIFITFPDVVTIL